MPVSFIILGGIVAFYPIIMGNGQVLLVIKGLIVCLLLWSGTNGGTLTPSFTLGVGSGFLLTRCLETFGLSLNPNLGMLLGATIFLGTTLDAP